LVAEGNENHKSQIPNLKQIPMTKIQIPTEAGIGFGRFHSIHAGPFKLVITTAQKNENKTEIF